MAEEARKRGRPKGSKDTKPRAEKERLCSPEAREKMWAGRDRYWAAKRAAKNLTAEGIPDSKDFAQDIAPKLPHLYGFKWYAWARAFFNSTNKMNLLVAGNQLSKSSTQIRKCIDWATNTKKWPILWPSRTPRIFWYLYPSKEVATLEVLNKWVPEFLPREEMAVDKVYGYEIVYDKKLVSHIVFRSGITLYFKTYSQGSDNLQTATVDAVFCDEEIPEEKYSEVRARLLASDGYYSMVFTATLNQDMWRRAMECQGQEQEMFADAFKLHVTMYDCAVYDDGTPSMWTADRIARAVASCQSKTEVQRRIMGRFVTEIGRKYGGFDPGRHFIKAVPIPESWRWYVGVDVGSGQGHKTHKAAIAFVAVRPDNKLGYVARGWRGDGEVTTAGDVFEKFKEIRGPLRMVNQRYDPSAKDFFTIASRNGEGFEKAERAHDIGEQVVNTLFQNDMLFIFDTEELRKLGAELSSVLKTTAKQNARDDFADGLRYCVTTIPWDWTAIKGGTKDEVTYDEWGPMPEPDPMQKTLTAAELEAEQIRRRRGEDLPQENLGWGELLNDIDEANENYG